MNKVSEHNWELIVERITRIEEQVKYISRIDGKLDHLLGAIDAKHTSAQKRADRLYATKQELQSALDLAAMVNKTQDAKITFIESKMWKVIRDVTILTVAVAFGVKQYGIF
jgi:hypothetical protein